MHVSMQVCDGGCTKDAARGEEAVQKNRSNNSNNSSKTTRSCTPQEPAPKLQLTNSHELSSHFSFLFFSTPHRHAPPRTATAGCRVKPEPLHFPIRSCQPRPPPLFCCGNWQLAIGCHPRSPSAPRLLPVLRSLRSSDYLLPAFYALYNGVTI